MKIISRKEFDKNKKELLLKIKKSVFIYPTDTIYGLGCDAHNSELVSRIRDLKGRYQRPFSIIAPSKKWILDNCEVGNDARVWVDKLPGHYTLILKLKHETVLAKEINPGLGTVGIRIPDNWFSEVVAQLGEPIVTTSVNISGKPFMTSIDNLDESIKNGVDFIFLNGKLTGKPSTLVFLDGKEVKVQER
ncbi:MAG: L-threonylcarbamoyladenylate synthase [Nanoarchaeota archaeon]|nr:threonylcarbamoyl-AMP synthase [Nanoarchaeota archaeon]MBU1029663.1 threonylcarbamoyl-AMP synthase [Nanoarchaeota archaeon]MBU1849873.1 threonylcarbamoyl-AMP synthase [Nanoarchaeota archaeon]